MRSGIYSIRHLPSGKQYIGSATNPVHRFAAHRSMLRKGKHHSPQLQRTWTRDGEEAFSFDVIERVPVPELLVAEQAHMNRRQTFDDRFGYNTAPVAGTRRGVPQPASVSAKLSAIHKGKPKSAEQRAKMSAAAKGRPKSAEHKARLKAAAHRQFSDPAARAAAAEYGRRAWEGDAAEITKAAIAKGMTPEVKAVMSATAKVRAQTSEGRAHQARIVEAARTPGAREKISASKRGRSISDETRAKMSAAQKRRYATEV